ncbi:MAG TPA: hypothetical protein VMT70_02355 [Vicinamibacteria bacterium]|nr:hypothetical protein [Vicinamibacteria bacterium]
MLPTSQQQLLGVGLLGIGLYFAVQLVRGIAGYLRYVRVAPTALVSWPTPRPARLRLLIGLGVSGAVLALVLAWQGKPAHHVVAFALMAVYFLGMVPLARRIRLGLFRDGVWAHRGFLRWEDVARIAFVEKPQIVLLLQARRQGSAFKLPVPADEYGAVRKLLEEKARAGVLRLEPAILGL